MREMPFLVTCSCGWSTGAANYRIAQHWRRHHLETFTVNPHHPLWDGKTHTATITKVKKGATT